VVSTRSFALSHHSPGKVQGQACLGLFTSPRAMSGGGNTCCCCCCCKGTKARRCLPVLHAACACGADTLAAPDPVALTSRMPNVKLAVRKIQLTAAQQHVLAEHWRVWRALLAPLDAEIAQLQEQMQQRCSQDSGIIGRDGYGDGDDKPAAAAAAAAGTFAAGPVAEEAACGAAGPGGGGAGSSSSSSSAAGTPGMLDRAAFIEGQMQLADRLKVGREGGEKRGLEGVW